MASLIDRMRSLQMMHNLAIAKYNIPDIKRLLKEIMEKDPKYYTPTVEDIRVGYECEIQTNFGYESFNNDNTIWEPIIVGFKEVDGGYSNKISDIIIGLDDGYQPIRTKYLTKEQIEENGWENMGIMRNGGTMLFTKLISKQEWYELQYCQNNKINPTTNIVISIIDYDPGMYGSGDSRVTKVLYNGDCKSINELRTIQSFLNIK